MRKFHIGVAAIAGAMVLSVAAVHAQGGPPPAPPAPSTNPADVAAGTYTIDPNHSQVMFTYTHFGLTHNMGLLSGATGSLTIDPKSPAATKLSVDVPINTMHSTIEALDKEFQEPMFFDAAKFPTAHFESTAVSVSGNSAQISGNLTIHGVTKPAVINATYTGMGSNPMSKKTTLGFQGTATIKRSDFGLGLAVPMVSDQVDLVITAGFEK
ncbi:MAG TPA: YceI family protein [Sphingomonadaceae bacterium]